MGTLVVLIILGFLLYSLVVFLTTKLFKKAVPKVVNYVEESVELKYEEKESESKDVRHK